MISSPALRIFLLSCFTMCSSNLLAGRVEITVTNILHKHAPVKVEVIDKAGFDSDKLPPLMTVEKIPDGDSVRLTIPQLLEGEYGFMVFQDLNSNGEVDFGFLGPKEPVAMSGNPKIHLLSLPAWDVVKVSVGKTPTKITLKMSD